MQIRWINDIDATGNQIFDSLWEAWEWADSLSSDFWASDMDHVGYCTRDEKVYAGQTGARMDCVHSGTR